MLNICCEQAQRTQSRDEQDNEEITKKSRRYLATKTGAGKRKDELVVSRLQEGDGGWDSLVVVCVCARGVTCLVLFPAV